MRDALDTTMLTQDQVSEIFAKVQRYATTDEVELIVSGGHSALTRFANNTIHQNVADDCYNLSVRAVFRDAAGARTARATTTRMDDESLRATVQRAEQLSRVQQPDLELPEMYAPNAKNATRQNPSRHFEETAAICPDERAVAVGKIVDVAKRHHLTSAGIFVINRGMEAIFNSRGVACFHEQTHAEFSVTMLDADSSGWQKANSPDVRVLDPNVLAESAAKKAVESKSPRAVEAGKYTVVLEPAAVLDLVGFMFYDFAGISLLDQRSFLNDRLGTELFGTNINIVDDVAHPLQTGSPFDGEGVPRSRVPLVEQGQIKNLVYARATVEKMRSSEMAAQAGRVESTGHGFALPNEMGEAPTNIVFENHGAATSRDAMIQSTERGILVTRLWYIREVEPYEKVLTGMTRDGTFLIENGKVVAGVRNFRFNQGLVEMLNKVEAMSDPVRSSGEEAFDMVVPAMKVHDFNFTEVTKF